MKKSRKPLFTTKLFILFIIASLTLPLLSSSCSASTTSKETKDGFYFDTIISITLYGTSSENEKLFNGCFSLAKKYENLFSTKISTSDISMINNSKGQPVIVDPETLRLVEKGLNYEEISDGIFSITCGALSELWNVSERAKNLDNESPIPSENEIYSALSSVGGEKVAINPEKYEVTLLDENTRLDLGGIAKGYIADRMKDYLLSMGCKNAIINLGGNVLCIGGRPDDKPFTVGVQKPFAEANEAAFTLSVDSCSVVTSGDYQRYFMKDGELFHHILGLGNGYPAATGLDSVTIVSDSSLDGDALSTICFLLGREKSLRFLKSLSEKQPDTSYEAVFIDTEGNIFPTDGLSDIIDIR